ncbi:MAG: hypothetical protein HGB12_15635, partial [Bacteroidetes bacterium]|nr:hypothetical protein [Bacteroidota bacterium]
MKKIMILLMLPILVSFIYPVKKSEKMMANVLNIDNIVKTLTDKYGVLYKDKIEKGVTQAAALWTDKDGDDKVFENFCYDNYVKPGAEQKALFDRISVN